ncbi:MAG: type IX secretion system membrane protein PorP/SprF [Flavobacteriaceae bacterium]|nr:type IX secretion system membrane protein PorP/SprF [Flavobacteriaceae bacterium]
MRSLFLVVFGILSCSLSWAQQDAQYTQYMYNTMVINPAYAGSRGVFSINALHRSQWVGLDGAPTTQTINLHSPVSERVGLGLSIVNDEIGNGTNKDTYFDAVFSYTIPAADKGKLSFGLNAGGHFLDVDFTKLQNYRPELVNGITSIDRKFSPNIGAGVYYHSENYYLGLSVPNFLETEHFDNSGEGSSYLATERMHIYLITGYVYELNNRTKIKPAILLKAVRGAPLQADISMSFLFNEKFTLGAAYRWDAALSAMLGFQLSEQLALGLAYDKETTDLGATQFNDGSFELFVRYELKTRHKKILSPRFF